MKLKIVLRSRMMNRRSQNRTQKCNVAYYEIWTHIFRTLRVDDAVGSVTMLVSVFYRASFMCVIRSIAYSNQVFPTWRAPSIISGLRRLLSFHFKSFSIATRYINASSCFTTTRHHRISLQNYNDILCG